MTLRPATLADLALLQRWDEQPHVIASDPNDEWNWQIELGRSPDWREQLIAEVDGRPIGFIQIIDAAREETHYWGDAPANLRAIDIWIGEEADLGRGYGTRMMELALARCFADPAVSAVLIDPLASNTRVHPFYERLGFRFLEARRFGEDDCLVYRFDRADYLRRHHSTQAIRGYSTMSESRAGRRIYATAGLTMRPYDLDGPLQPDMSYAPLSHDAGSERGSYLMRMEPGSATIPHTHTCREEFLILEGEAIEDDGTVLKAGDWIVYEPGTRHNTRTVTGCLLLGLDWDPPGRKSRG